MIEKIKKNPVLALTLLAILLIKMPPFYFLGLQSAFLTSHSLARYIIFALFLVLAKRQLFGNTKGPARSERNLIIIFLVYFFFQSFSVVAAGNIQSFAGVYKDIVFPGFFLLAVLFQTGIAKGLAKVFIGASVLNFFYQMVIFFAPSTFRLFGERFIYSEHFRLVEVNILRGRLFVETYDEIAIPIIFYLLFKEKNKKMKLAYVLILAMVVLSSLLSNFRTRILMLAFALGCSFFILIKGKLKVKVYLVAALVIVAVITHFISASIFGYSFLDRLTFSDVAEDVETVESRIENIKNSIAMGFSRPLTGVGLNNYYLYLPETKKEIFSISLNSARKTEAGFASVNPHNIFAQIISETGILSFGFYVFILAYFLRQDIGTLKEKDNFKKSLTISFWTLFIYSLFNPTTTLAYNSLFWLLRGVLSQDLPLRNP